VTLNQSRAFVLIVFTLVVGLLSKLTNISPGETFGYAAFLLASIAWVDVRYVSLYLSALAGIVKKESSNERDSKSAI
jgi:hypothetical protein